MKVLSKSLVIIAAWAIVACDEPYSKDPNENAAPAIMVRDENYPEAIRGTRDILMRDALGTSTALTRAEGNVMNHEWDNVSPIYPSNFPFIVFNKLMDGSTIETTAKDELTGRDLGNCGPVAGAITVTEDGANVSNLRTCYSPSDKLVGVQILNAPFGSDPPPAIKQFLKYETDYVWTVTSNVKDKKGRALEPFPVAARTRPFMLLVVTDNAKLNTVYGAPGTGFEAIKKVPALPSTTSVIRLVFSGSMSGKAATEALRNAILVDGDDQEITLTDPDSGDVVRTEFSNAGPPPDRAAVTRDKRQVHVYSPYVQLGATAAARALPPGNYKIILPTTVTDDGTVMGTAAAPVTVPLKAQMTIPFTIAEPEEE